jgi:hypothetical protein
MNGFSQLYQKRNLYPLYKLDVCYILMTHYKARVLHVYYLTPGTQVLINSRLLLTYYDYVIIQHTVCCLEDRSRTAFHEAYVQPFLV